MKLALSSAEARAPAREVAFGFEIRETATLYKPDGTGFFARNPQVDLDRTKLYVQSLTKDAGTTPDNSAWVMALPLEFGDSILGAQFSNTYTIGGQGAPALADCDRCPAASRHRRSEHRVARQHRYRCGGLA